MVDQLAIALHIFLTKILLIMNTTPIVTIRTTQPQPDRINLARLPPQSSLTISAINNTNSNAVIYIFVEKLVCAVENSKFVLQWAQVHGKPKTRKPRRTVLGQKQALVPRNDRAPALNDDLMPVTLLQLSKSNFFTVVGNVHVSSICCKVSENDILYHSWLKINLEKSSSIENLKFLLNVSQGSQKMKQAVKIVAPFYRLRVFSVQNNTIQTVGEPFVTGVINRGKNEERIEVYMRTVKLFWPNIAAMDPLEMKKQLHANLNNLPSLTIYDYIVVWKLVHSTKNTLVQQQHLSSNLNKSGNQKTAIAAKTTIYNSAKEIGGTDYLCKNVPVCDNLNFEMWTEPFVEKASVDIYSDDE